MVDAEAWKPGDDMAFEQVLQTYDALSFIILRQNVLFLMSKKTYEGQETKTMKHYGQNPTNRNLW